MLLLGAAHVWGGLPSRSVVTLGVPLLVWGVIAAGLCRQSTRGWSVLAATVLIPWLLGSGVLFAAVYHVDRGGWLWYQLSGYDVTIDEKVAGVGDCSVAEFLSVHPQFAVDKNNAARLVLPTGDHTFVETTVIPRGTQLTIEPGCTLHFGAGCSLLSFSPIVAIGTEKRPIRFTAANTWHKWGVVGLLHAESGLFEHARFEHARQASADGVPLPGGLSFIETAAEIRNCRFENMYGKDAVYVQRANVSIRDNVFRNARKDGLDLDGGTGTIEGNVFVDCDDEGIDLSDADLVQVRGNTIRDRRGGRIGTDRNLESLQLANKLEHSHEE